MSPMLGKRTKTKLAWSQCDCGCRAGSRSRKAERRIQRKADKAQAQREIAQEWAYVGGAW